MDPDAALSRLRRLMEQLNDQTDPVDLEVYETFSGLDAWLTGGGFLPAPWARARPEEPR